MKIENIGENFSDFGLGDELLDRKHSTIHERKKEICWISLKIVLIEV